ncbi:YqaE/Pmp3 family membrane protein [Mucilaginibacter sp. X5P1]|uniref:YqaE/Pmp3 family membrane protein n=1 Tax=Mucilaginibacter sp. X5P1 TaxID=2723088 RepID=UPI0016077D8D
MRYFLCFICPPAAVLTTGRIGSFILSIILTIFFWIPGIIYAILVTNDFYSARRNRRVVRAIRANRY